MYPNRASCPAWLLGCGLVGFNRKGEIISEDTDVEAHLVNGEDGFAFVVEPADHLIGDHDAFDSFVVSGDEALELDLSVCIPRADDLAFDKVDRVDVVITPALLVVRGPDNVAIETGKRLHP